MDIMQKHIVATFPSYLNVPKRWSCNKQATPATVCYQNPNIKPQCDMMDKRRETFKKMWHCNTASLQVSQVWHKATKQARSLGPGLGGFFLGGWVFWGQWGKVWYCSVHSTKPMLQHGHAMPGIEVAYMLFALFCLPVPDRVHTWVT